MVFENRLYIFTPAASIECINGYIINGYIFGNYSIEIYHISIIGWANSAEMVVNRE